MARELGVVVWLGADVIPVLAKALTEAYGPVAARSNGDGTVTLVAEAGQPAGQG